MKPEKEIIDFLKQWNTNYSEDGDKGWFQRINLGYGIITKGLFRPDVDDMLIRLGLKDVDFRGKKYLDIGCAEGFYPMYARQNGADISEGIDINKNMIYKAKWIKDNIGIDAEYFNIDINKVNKLKIYDIITAFSVLRHLYQPYIIIQRISNSLIRNGIFILEEPIWELENKKKYDKIEVYNPNTISNYEKFPTEYCLIDLLKTFFQKVEIIGYGKTYERRVFKCQK